MQETHYMVPACPVRIALVADLHERLADGVLASLRAHHPSLIAIAGDLVDKLGPDARCKTEQNPDVLKFLSTCATIAPTVYSLGNHEAILSSKDYMCIAKTGCVVLDNTWKRIGSLVVGGLTSAQVANDAGEQDLPTERPPQGSRAGASWLTRRGRGNGHSPYTQWLHGFCATEGYHVLLCHHPEYWSLVRAWPIELVLSGHAHGGQWRYYSLRMRSWEGVFAPGQGLFPKLTAGVHDNRLVISRGLANTAPFPRFFHPREVVYVN